MPMKFVLLKDGVKREIESPFAICASPQDLRDLADRIAEHLAHKPCFGWMEVYDRQRGGENERPRGWRE